ncbi:MAG: cytochrome b/b6 domain-containing protein [Terricaulis sp.]
MANANTTARTILVWDPGVRIFHWLLVIGVALAFLSSEEDSVLAAWHISIGWVAALLIAFRLAWGFVGGEHARFATFIRPSQIGVHLEDLLSGKVEPSIGHNPLGALAVVALLVLVAITILTGVLGGDDIHEVIAYALLGLVALHVTAVLLMSHMTKENLIRAMLTGRKCADRHPGARDASPPAKLALPIAAIAVGAIAYGATRTDPKAFLPHISAERGEEGGLVDDDRGESERGNGGEEDGGWDEGDAWLLGPR